jgi:hypothetical protein
LKFDGRRSDCGKIKVTNGERDLFCWILRRFPGMLSNGRRF